MTPESLHDLFLAAASTAGALIGLLFVAVSIAHDRLTAADTGLIHRIRASASLTAFTNALAVSLFALLPDGSLGTTSTAVGLLGLAFISGSLLSVIRHLKLSRLRDLTFLVFLTAVCIQEVVAGQLFNHTHDLSDAEWLAILVICCFLIGIQRAWELIGGPDIGLSREVITMVREHEAPREEAVRDEQPASGGVETTAGTTDRTVVQSGDATGADSDAIRTNAGEDRTDSDAIRTNAGEDRTDPDAPRTNAREDRTDPDAPRTNAREDRTDPEAPRTESSA